MKSGYEYTPVVEVDIQCYSNIVTGPGSKLPIQNWVESTVLPSSLGLVELRATRQNNIVQHRACSD